MVNDTKAVRRKSAGVHVPGCRAPGGAKPDIRIQIDGVRKEIASHGRNRTLIAAFAFAVCFFALALQVINLTLFNETTVFARSGAAVATQNRADIVDRNGEILATNLQVGSIYADPREIWDPVETADMIVGVLPGIEREALVKRLSSDRAFIWVKRDVTPRQQQIIHELGLPGVDFKKEQRRVYPQENAAAHVLGYVDVDNQGIAGLEKSLDDVLRDFAKTNQAVELSIDLRAQHALADELSASMRTFRAKGAAGLVLDANNGEVVAMASLPDFDPNDPAASPSESRFNRASLGVYEMGSTFKIFTTAMALDYGAATLATRYDATKPLRIGRHTIRDYHSENRWLTVPEIFMHSSNIGSARIAMDVGIERQQAFLERLGLLEKPSFELPEVGTPMSPARWREINAMTISFGHGIAVSPLQLASAAAALVNGGHFVKATLLRRQPGAALRTKRVIANETSQIMRRLMRQVVEKGTGKKADVVGYSVAGKTGTAEKAGRHGYRRRALLSSFLGVFPSDKPRFIVLAILDEPQGTAETFGYATGGWTAAPVVANVVRRIGPILGVDPTDNPSETILAAY
jgi:cell division protein FtsI (penicillin-binding protein 3)